MGIPQRADLLGRDAEYAVYGFAQRFRAAARHPVAADPADSAAGYPGESRLGLEILSDAMEQAVAAPHFRAYDQALLLAESLVATAMEDDHNLSLQLQRVQRELEEYLQN